MLDGRGVVEHGKDEERTGYAERDDPDDGDLGGREAGVLGAAVAQREAERHVAVDRDHAQVADRRRREEDVERVPGEAEQLRYRQTVCKHTP